MDWRKAAASLTIVAALSTGNAQAARASKKAAPTTQKNCSAVTVARGPSYTVETVGAPVLTRKEALADASESLAQLPASQNPNLKNLSFAECGTRTYDVWLKMPIRESSTEALSGQNADRLGLRVDGPKPGSVLIVRTDTILPPATPSPKLVSPHKSFAKSKALAKPKAP